MHKIQELLRDFPLLPVPESLDKKLGEWLDSLGKDESYPEDAGPSSSGKSAEERR